MLLKVRYFASIREAMGLSGEPVTTQAPDLAALRDELIQRGVPYADALARGKTIRMALNQLMCNESAGLSEGAEVAFFPPVTGG